jgi:glycosyltransferase involved in cell wall biosynthesis
MAQPKEVIGIPFPYFLYIGRLSYEKGADRIIELSEEHPQMNFVLLGAKAPVNSTKKFFPPKRYPNVILKTESTPEEKAWLIKNAAAVLVPSRVQETYSLVVVEAAQHGTPVLVPAGGGAEETFKNWHGDGQAFRVFKSPEINLNAWIISQRKSTREAKDLHPLDLKFEEAIAGLWQTKQENTIRAEI